MNMEDAIERAKRISTAMLSDALSLLGVERGIMSPSIKQLVPGTRTVGLAFTVATPTGDISPCEEALDRLSEGKILVIDTGGDTKYCYLGEQMSTNAKNAGAAAIIIDGFVRDIEGIVTLGFPVFGRGVIPKAAPLHGSPGKFGVPVLCGGCIVEPGDIIRADADGVVVIPRKESQRVTKVAEKLQEIDNERFRVVKEGKRLSELPNIVELHRELIDKI